ncbi:MULTISPECIES: NAD(P)H-dependent glycerol-3-phosphate dehydrogenase [unclassified Novosphingobium]|uniref:NAD(P)H-dependent glycerol-3-phosphate dehydrogenase n=1 Tax=unclassified Novosphingobium TaxID=2644732 RepID=UPI00146CF955|nr:MULTISPECIES: NAD(P)H-dependent glycerol-3-phosphate dehydrogenase [unclassified Novosphingobium]NMN03143.1 glycerol-3-phosphate dehydrogenase (NAD(P)+) [Novosphingobium sp. SG919]NMN86867.1 glycerol-3-phosphate dehydrogenase (NAD(P)+) [Novosphingobium sp. SG916]
MSVADVGAPGVGVIGAGAWGTALAQMVASDGRRVVLWAREAALAETINREARNPTYLPGAALAPQIAATSDLAALAHLPVLLLVTPAQFLGSVMAGLPDYAGDLVLCAKGIEAGTGRLMAQVAQDAAPRARVAVLSGPTFAHEVAAGLPTAVTLACSGGDAQWQRLAPAVARPTFRPYYSADVIGAEIGGAVKNVLAIACGVVDGLGLGQNARAALISRGFAEMQRFGLAMGAQGETLSGLSGLGDLVLTCSSPSSRNFSLGKALGEGQTASQALSGRSSVAEGAYTAPVLADLARQKGIAMPLVDAVVTLVQGQAPARDVVASLLARPLRAERPLG